MIRILLCAFVVCLFTGCAQDFAATGQSEQDVVVPETVCGLPTQCHPFSCTILANGVPRCVHNRISDSTCASACDGHGFCPSGDTGGCDNLCAANVAPSAFDQCYVECVNNISRSCQDGQVQ